MYNVRLNLLTGDIFKRVVIEKKTASMYLSPFKILRSQENVIVC